MEYRQDQKDELAAVSVHQANAIAGLNREFLSAMWLMYSKWTSKLLSTNSRPETIQTSEALFMHQ